MEKQIINALRKKYEGDIELAKANVSIFLRQSVGVGEHPDIMATIDLEVEKIAEAEDKLVVLQQHFEENAKS